MLFAVKKSSLNKPMRAIVRVQASLPTDNLGLTGVL
jgi:hypothetical protein